MPEIWNAIAPGLPTLLGVIVGGLITYLTTQALETRKWKQQKRDTYLADYRDALKLALDWIDPINRAIDRATQIVLVYEKRVYVPESDPNGLRGDAAGPMKYWPDLAKELSTLDLRLASRALLPPGIIQGQNAIVDGLAELGDLAQHLADLRDYIANPRRHAPEEFGDENEVSALGLQEKIRSKLFALRRIGPGILGTHAR